MPDAQRAASGQTDTLPCGHPTTAVVGADEGTAYCGECAPASNPAGSADKTTTRSPMRPFPGDERSGRAAAPKPPRSTDQRKNTRRE